MFVFLTYIYGKAEHSKEIRYVSLYRFADYINKVNMRYCCKTPYNKPYKKVLFCSGRLSSHSSVYRSTYEIINHYKL